MDTKKSWTLCMISTTNLHFGLARPNGQRLPHVIVSTLARVHRSRLERLLKVRDDVVDVLVAN